jgi:hypothetical protein
MFSSLFKGSTGIEVVAKNVMKSAKKPLPNPNTEMFFGVETWKGTNRPKLSGRK